MSVKKHILTGKKLLNQGYCNPWQYLSLYFWIVLKAVLYKLNDSSVYKMDYSHGTDKSVEQ